MTLPKGCFRLLLVELKTRHFSVRGRVGLSPVWSAPSQVVSVALGFHRLDSRLGRLLCSGLWAAWRPQKYPVISPTAG